MKDSGESQFRIVEGPVRLERELIRVQISPEHGGQDVFIGRVRPLNKGRWLARLSYNVQEETARAALDEISAEARAQWGEGVSVFVAHSQGDLQAGDVSMVVSVCAEHTREACMACRYVISEMKKRVPIWTKAFYVDGASEWLLVRSA
jgi:molybdopterin synthase catalytic subunit